MLKGNSFLDYSNLFSSEQEKNDKIILYFSIDSKKSHMEIIYCICEKYRKFKNLEIYIFEKTLVLSIICSKCSSEDEKNELISKKPKKTCKILDCIEHLLSLASALNGSATISALLL